MKVTDSIGSREKTVSQIDLGLEGMDPDVADAIKEEVGTFLVESVLSAVAEAKTPVSGESWPILSKDYKEHKSEEGSGTVANMSLNGEMLDSLTFEKTSSGIELGFFDDQAWKADGHLKFSGAEGTAPKRRFLPAKGESFKEGIEKEVESIIRDELAARIELDRKDFSNIETKSELWSVLRDYFPELDRSDIIFALTRNSAAFKILEDLGLDDLLV
jgi:hypothetical protein